MNPPGDERPLAAFYARLLADAGLETAVIETPSRSPRPGRAAAWAVLPGRGSRAPIVLLSHLDVVPAAAADWDQDPFEGVVRRGYVHGRGALDAKGISVVHLLALVTLAESGRALDRDVVFLATPDEETGGAEGAGWLTRERRDLLRGARYLLTEGGSVLASGRGARRTWSVGVVEKSPCWLRLVATGPAGHSSVPRPGLAVERLVAALDRVRRFEPAVRVTPEVARMFAALAPQAAREDAAGFENLDDALAIDPEFRRRFLSQPGYAALVANTVSITVLEGGPRTNVAPKEARAHIDARLLPGERCEDFAETIENVVGDPAVRVEILLSFATRSSPTDTSLYRAIERTAARVDPDALVVPRVSAGFTDSHWFRDLGIAAYGFTPRWHRPGELRGVHGANERISIENLERGVETLIELLLELDRLGG